MQILSGVKFRWTIDFFSRKARAKAIFRMISRTSFSGINFLSSLYETKFPVKSSHTKRTLFELFVINFNFWIFGWQRFFIVFIWHFSNYLTIFLSYICFIFTDSTIYWFYNLLATPISTKSLIDGFSSRKRIKLSGILTKLIFCSC